MKSSKTGLIVILFAALSWGGCATSDDTHFTTAPQKGAENEVLTLREADVIKVSFPGTPNLDTIQAIRRDGLIALPLIGEVKAVGKTSAQFQAELQALYAKQLVSKEVLVTVVSSTFPTFVSGAVLRPGKVSSDHPITVLEAIMEAGGFDSAKADLRAVKVVRQLSDGKTETYKVNVKEALEGKQTEPFYLKPSDIVFVPERLVVF